MAVSDAQPTVPSSSEPLRAKCGWIIALGVVYLVADAAAYVTGQTLNINGGMLMS